MRTARSLTVSCSIRLGGGCLPNPPDVDPPGSRPLYLDADPPWTEWQTFVKALPWPKLILRAVKIRNLDMFVLTSGFPKSTCPNSLPPANEVCEGYVFTPICQSFCSLGGVCPRCTSSPAIRGRLPPPTPDQRQTPPPLPEQCMLGNTGNKRAVRILLECILVLTCLWTSANESPESL